jgi:hypothetical protein
VTTASVCRLSGKLASEGCQDVEVVDKDGRLVRKSMVYNEYFDRGTEPTSYCDMHPSHGLLGKLAGMFGNEHPPAPPHIEDTGAPASAVAVAVATNGDVEHTEAAPAPVKKKRGFWSRVFGKGKADDREQAEEVAPVKKKSGG